MNNEKPRLILHVKDLNASKEFYTRTIGWMLAWEDSEKDVLQLNTKDGDPAAILTSKAPEDGKQYLDDVFLEPQLGNRFYFTQDGLQEMHNTLQSNGHEVTDFIIEEGFGQTLVLTDPDGYHPAFWEELYLADEAIIDLYRGGPGMLEEALDSLTESELDLVRSPEKWSIRQTVLHLVDSDITTMQKIKFALAEPGREYKTNLYDPNRWVDGTRMKKENSKPLSSFLDIYESIY
ncbi:DinB family protein [Alkalihalobacillus sp. AL-G]|uniref:DinB family protein n=1 Tax=Alkalihalobacillus sp. AL-G TaxID=2926399 RepID=UPI00272DC4DC|nr:DinB family protein [Alkalihalobacillus sp. AL-G]WLD94598.1 hypothetical protein MOJ78_06855 [Alkalihalobacillus sp. AL-G]